MEDDRIEDEGEMLVCRFCGMTRLKVGDLEGSLVKLEELVLYLEHQT